MPKEIKTPTEIKMQEIERKLAIIKNKKKDKQKK